MHIETWGIACECMRGNVVRIFPHTHKPTCYPSFMGDVTLIRLDFSAGMPASLLTMRLCALYPLLTVRR